MQKNLMGQPLAEGQISWEKPLNYGKDEAHLQNMPVLDRITISYTPTFDTYAATAFLFRNSAVLMLLNNPTRYLLIILMYPFDKNRC